MSKFDKAVSELAENIKTPEQIISKRTLASLIEETEELYQQVRRSRTPPQWESWQLKVIGDNLRELRKINQKLGYE